MLKTELGKKTPLEENRIPHRRPHRTSKKSLSCQSSLLTQVQARKGFKLRHFPYMRRLLEVTSRQQTTQRTLLAWLGVEYAIEKPKRN